jgi:hypothetical protein
LRRREDGPGWLGQSKTDLREFKTTIRNLHLQPMRITIIDRVPYAENTAITVEQLRETTPPTERQVEDKRGVMAWIWDYQPGESREVRLGYRLKWPAEREIKTEPKPLGRLGGVDGFDEDEAESKGHHGTVVLGRLLAAQRHPLEALQLAHKLLNAGAGAIERSGEEPRPGPG